MRDTVGGDEPAMPRGPRQPPRADARFPFARRFWFLMLITFRFPFSFPFSLPFSLLFLLPFPTRFSIASCVLIACVAGVAGGCAREAAPCAPAASTVLRVAVPNAQAPRVTPRQIMPPSLLTELPLVALNDRGVPMPGLATAWTTPDRQTWTLTLRDDLRTHAGVSLTAARLREVLLQKMAARASFDPVARDLAGIDIPDARTLVVHLRRPSSAFLESLAFFGLTAEESEPDLSAGPFRLLQFTDTRVEFEAFPPPGPPPAPQPNGLSRLTVTFYGSSRMAWAAFLRNEADLLYEVPPTTAGLLARNPDVQIFPAGGRHALLLAFRQSHPRLRDARVRQAISLAIDREEIARNALGGYARPAAGPFAPYYWATEQLTPEGPYDPAAARRLLREAGVGQDEPLELVCLTSAEFPLIADVAAALEVQLARVNIKLRLEPQRLSTVGERLMKGDFDAAAFSVLVGTGNLWPYIFWHSSTPRPFLRSGYTAADAALDALYTAASPDAERRAAREVVEVMRRDPPAAFILPFPVIRAVRRSWRVPPQTADIVDVRRTLARWTLDTPACRPAGAP